MQQHTHASPRTTLGRLPRLPPPMVHVHCPHDGLELRPQPLNGALVLELLDVAVPVKVGDAHGQLRVPAPKLPDTLCKVL